MNKGKLCIIPLGGLDQIGMNITAFEYEDDIVVVDCGLAFPEDDMLGIDLVIPDTTYLEENIDRVRGLVITRTRGSYRCDTVCIAEDQHPGIRNQAYHGTYRE